jgi:SAM-dependent methyltransferase
MRDGSGGDVFERGLFPLCPATHDQGLRWLFDLSAVLLLLDCRPGDRVLDLGAGSGFSSEMLARFGYRVIAVDPDARALLHNRHRAAIDRARIAGSVTVVQGVAQALPFDDGTFDGALGLNVLHHVPDLEQATGELARVLKPGARAVFCEPGLDHLSANETERARAEHGEDDRAFDVLTFLGRALESGFGEAMLSATLQSPLRLLPLQEVELYRSGRHPRPHLTPSGVLDELHRRHAYAMLVRQGSKPKTSRHPGTLACAVTVDEPPREAEVGGRMVLRVAATNTGDSIWIAAPSDLGGHVTVGIKLLDATGRLVSDRLGRTPIPHDVPPGDSAVVDVPVDLPIDLLPGRHRLKVDLVDELVCWISDLGHSTVPTIELDIRRP